MGAWRVSDLEKIRKKNHISRENFDKMFRKITKVNASINIDDLSNMVTEVNNKYKETGKIPSQDDIEDIYYDDCYWHPDSERDKCPFGYEYVINFKKKDGTYVRGHCRRIRKK
jgi:hypothetical protein